MDAELPTGANDQHDCACISIGDDLLLDVLVDERDQVGQGFAAARRRLRDHVLAIEDTIVALDLDLGELGDVVLDERVLKQRVEVELLEGVHVDFVLKFYELWLDFVGSRNRDF